MTTETHPIPASEDITPAMKKVLDTSYFRACDQALQFASMGFSPRMVISSVEIEWQLARHPEWDDAIYILAHAYRHRVQSCTRKIQIQGESPVRDVLPMPGELINGLSAQRFVTCACGREFATTENYRRCGVCRAKTNEMDSGFSEGIM